MGLSDGMKRGCSKEFSFRFEVSFGVRFMKSKLNLRSRLAEVSYDFLKARNVKKKLKKKTALLEAFYLASFDADVGK